MKEINICFCVDETYAPYAAISIASAIKNKKTKQQYHFYIGTAGLSDKTKSNIEAMADGCKIDFISISRKDFAGYKCTIGNITEAAAYRLIMPHLIKDIDRLLYIDCDTLILDDLEDLFNYDLQNKTIGVVLDIDYVPHEKRLSVSSYFNSGVLLIDCKRWIELDCFNRVRQALNNPKSVLPDQDALNMVLDFDKTLLPVKYNTMNLFHKTACCYRGQIAEDFKQALKTPTILHFIGPIKPWHTEYFSREYAKRYADYSKDSMFDACVYSLIFDRASSNVVKRSRAQLMSDESTFMKIGNKHALYPYKIFIDGSGRAFDEEGKEL